MSKLPRVGDVYMTKNGKDVYVVARGFDLQYMWLAGPAAAPGTIVMLPIDSIVISSSTYLGNIAHIFPLIANHLLENPQT